MDLVPHQDSISCPESLRFTALDFCQTNETIYSDLRCVHTASWVCDVPGEDS